MKKLEFKLRESITESGKPCLVIETNGEPVIEIIPNEIMNGFLLLDNSPNRTFNRYLIDSNYEHTFEVHQSKNSKNLWDNLGVSYCPSRNTVEISIMTDSIIDPEFRYKYSIPIGCNWVVKFLTTDLVKNSFWMIDSLWLTFYEEE